MQSQSPGEAVDIRTTTARVEHMPMLVLNSCTTRPPLANFMSYMLNSSPVMLYQLVLEDF
jgi:hypothetical protein